MRHLSIEFCEDRLGSFSRNPANKQTNADENITSLAEVISRVTFYRDTSGRESLDSRKWWRKWIRPWALTFVQSALRDCFKYCMNIHVFCTFYWMLCISIQMMTPHMCYHVKCGSFAIRGVLINRKEPPKLWIAGNPPPWGGGVADPLKQAPSHNVLPLQIWWFCDKACTHK